MTICRTHMPLQYPGVWLLGSGTLKASTYRRGGCSADTRQNGSNGGGGETGGDVTFGARVSTIVRLSLLLYRWCFLFLFLLTQLAASC